jgi:hypothetical protein
VLAASVLKLTGMHHEIPDGVELFKSSAELVPHFPWEGTNQKQHLNNDFRCLRLIHMGGCSGTYLLGKTLIVPES